jgi:hypothetical protein
MERGQNYSVHKCLWMIGFEHSALVIHFFIALQLMKTHSSCRTTCVFTKNYTTPRKRLSWQAHVGTITGITVGSGPTLDNSLTGGHWNVWQVISMHAVITNIM